MNDNNMKENATDLLSSYDCQDIIKNTIGYLDEFCDDLTEDKEYRDDLRKRLTKVSYFLDLLEQRLKQEEG